MHPQTTDERTPRQRTPRQRTTSCRPATAPARLLLCAIAFSLLLAACRPDPARRVGPPDVDWTAATTYPDGRAITEPRFAAARIAETGETYLFDDIGRLVSASEQAGDASGLWVRDYEVGGWLDAATAVYVASPRLVTPRGSGLLAVGDVERAWELARQLGGRVFDFDQLAGYLAAAAAAPPPAPGGLELGGVLVKDGNK
jgi:nitrous oxide reductase accessory protein NosL